jgi:hypothetical protein
VEAVGIDPMSHEYEPDLVVESARLKKKSITSDNFFFCT